MTGLELPKRAAKPRTTGRTHVLDKGHGTSQIEDALSVVADYVDLVKLGWGTSLVTPNLADKIALYRRHGAQVCFGGTLFELYWLQGRLDDYVAYMKDLGVIAVEVSDGTIEMEMSEKLAVIERLTRDFEVHSEVGSKDSATVVSPVKWVRAIKAELEAGASFVILEGRESGTAGLYRPSGEIRMGLIDEILEAGIDPDRLIFEAPNKAQQVWLIKQLGANANLANIPLSEVIALETLRLGLRADTLLHFHGSDG
jgi:phosphosulfolactate synthase